jgi:hypothetical protein
VLLPARSAATASAPGFSLARPSGHPRRRPPLLVRTSSERVGRWSADVRQRLRERGRRRRAGRTGRASLIAVTGAPRVGRRSGRACAPPTRDAAGVSAPSGRGLVRVAQLEVGCREVLAFHQLAHDVSSLGRGQRRGATQVAVDRSFSSWGTTWSMKCWAGSLSPMFARTT